MNQQTNNKRIAKNTLLLYARMLVYMVITLYTSRVLLAFLGVEDYGIYNVVGGIVMMFGFLNTAMISASQRFISYEQGKGNTHSQNKIFSTSVVIHITIAIVILIISESLGLWWLYNKLVVDDTRFFAAQCVYQCSILSFLLNVTTVPYISSVIAHEKMGFYAIVTILDCLLKLLIVLLLPFFPYDHLIVYAALLLSVSLLNFFIYRFYTKRQFSECHFKFHKDVALYKKMLSFAGWSFVGNFGVSAKDYGVNIVLNLFGGPAVNAARGIAYQVTMAINGFVSNFQTAMRPQITKRYAAGEIDSMIKLVITGSKFSFFLLSIITTPVLLRTNYILELWLDNVPESTDVFLKLALIMGLINSFYGPFLTGIQATGHIKLFQITVAIIMCMDIPLSYYFLSMGFEPYTVMYVAITTAIAALVARVFLLYRQVHFDIANYFFSVIGRCLILFFIMVSLPYCMDGVLKDDFWGLVALTVISLFWSIIVIGFGGLNRKERNTILSHILIKMKIRK